VKTSKWYCITIIIVVALVLGFSVFVVSVTGSTDGLVAVGQMVALIIDAFVPG
jgi:hypothetical protein